MRYALARSVAAAAGPLLVLTALAPWISVGPMGAAGISYGVAALAIVFGALAAPIKALAWGHPAAVTAGVGVLLSAAAVFLPPVPSGIVGSLGVIACGTVLGSMVGTRVQAPGHLLPVALMSAAMDILSVEVPGGVTHQLVKHPALLRVLMVRAALPPGRIPEPAIGFGDVVFVSLYLSACTQFRLSRGRTVLALVLGLSTAWIVAVTAGLASGVPALPFLGGMVVLAHRDARRVAREDRTVTWLSAAFFVGAILRVSFR